MEVGEAILRYFRASLIFIFLVDGGNQLGLQYLTLAIYLLISASFGSMRKQTLQAGLFVCCALILITLSSFTSGASSGILVWLFNPLIMALFLGFGVKSGDSDALEMASGFFSILIITIFIVRIIDHTPLVLVVNFLMYNVDGFFNTKSAWGFEQPVVYFQSTLVLVPFFVLNLARGNRLWAALNLIALMCAPSRFGVLVCILFASPKMRQLVVRKFSVIFALIALSPFIALIIQPFAEVFGQRGAAIIGIAHQLDMSGSNLFFGAGLHEPFFDPFLHIPRDNFENSLVEFIRKFGAVAYILYFGLLFAFAKERTDSTNIKLLIIVLCSASMANPILFSLSTLLLLTAHCNTRVPQ